MTIDVDVIERVIDIAASPETVFTLLTDPVEYVRWKGRAAELDPRAGGAFHVSFKDAAVRGEYVEVIPNRRVVFTWGWVAPGAAVGPSGRGARRSRSTSSRAAPGRVFGSCIAACPQRSARATPKAGTTSCRG